MEFLLKNGITHPEYVILCIFLWSKSRFLAHHFIQMSQTEWNMQKQETKLFGLVC